MARPREFDVDAAVDAAVRLFWAQGYRATTMSDVERAMNIGRASVYAAFSDKEALFLRSLDHYRERYTLPSLSALDEGRPPLDALRELFDRLAARYTDPSTPPGCLVVLNAGHLTAEAPEARRALAASVAEGEGRIARTLGDAAAAGELREGLPVASLARFLAATTQGMATMARLGRSPAEVRDIGRVALGALPRPPRGART